MGIRWRSNSSRLVRATRPIALAMAAAVAEVAMARSHPETPNRRTAGAPLHTNFKLSENGEYLALVRSDGTTVVSAYAPSFPPQVGHVSGTLMW